MPFTWHLVEAGHGGALQGSEHEAGPKLEQPSVKQQSSDKNYSLRTGNQGPGVIPELHVLAATITPSLYPQPCTISERTSRFQSPHEEPIPAQPVSETECGTELVP